MNLDGLFGNKKLFADLAIAVTFGYLAENLDFAACQGFITYVFRELRCKLRRNALFARVNLANHFQPLLRRHTFPQISTGASLQGKLDLNVTLKRRQHDYARLWKFRPDRDHGIDPAFVRKA